VSLSTVKRALRLMVHEDLIDPSQIDLSQVDPSSSVGNPVGKSPAHKADDKAPSLSPSYLSDFCSVLCRCYLCSIWFPTQVDDACVICGDWFPAGLASLTHYPPGGRPPVHCERCRQSLIGLARQLGCPSPQQCRDAFTPSARHHKR
jgi:hypothetical protein